jgi:hypothetical protein
MGKPSRFDALRLHGRAGNSTQAGKYDRKPLLGTASNCLHQIQNLAQA